MSRTTRFPWKTRALCFGVGFVLLGLAAAPSVGAAQKRYQTTTIRGSLANPKSGEPLVGAMITFTSTTPEEPTVQAITDSNGQFVAEGLGYASYAIAIVTAEGEVIRGVNQLPITPGESVEIEFTLSDRVRSSTAVFNQPDRFLAVVDKEKRGTKRFWREFGIFFGVAVASGAAVF